MALSYLTHVYPQKEWRKEYNEIWSHSALNHRPPTLDAINSVDSNKVNGMINGDRSLNTSGNSKHKNRLWDAYQ